MKVRQDNAVKPGDRLSILIADDDRGLLNLMSMNLRRDGDFEVLTATSCKEAFTKAITHAPDLVLMDIRFEDGEEDGIDCLKKMRDQGFKGPVFIFTGHTGMDLLKRAQKAGADDYLVKGNVGDLAGEIKRLLDLNIRRILEGKEFNRILNSGYLKTMGLTDSQIGAMALMVKKDMPQDKDLAKYLGLRHNTLEVMMHRIRRQLKINTAKQLVQTLTILDLFGHG